MPESEKEPMDTTMVPCRRCRRLHEHEILGRDRDGFPSETRPLASCPIETALALADAAGDAVAGLLREDRWREAGEIADRAPAAWDKEDS
jgi:hypothetical protein